MTGDAQKRAACHQRFTRRTSRASPGGSRSSLPWPDQGDRIACCIADVIWAQARIHRYRRSRYRPVVSPRPGGSIPAVDTRPRLYSPPLPPIPSLPAPGAPPNWVTCGGGSVTCYFHSAQRESENSLSQRGFPGAFSLEGTNHLE